MQPPAPAQPLITILLSTYNGERFLPAQLGSFLAQSHTNWVLYWRDDGSSDNTLAIMRGFTMRVGRDRCIESPNSGPHLGASPSFLTLLSECLEPDRLRRAGPGAAIEGVNQPLIKELERALGAEMVAFADQDDVWLADKLCNAVELLRPAGELPALYCARQYLVDETLQGRRLSVSHRNTPAFPASLTQNIANGNTLVMNKAACALVANMGSPEGTVHDWWSYIVVSACGGQIIFDERPSVFYRLHKSNLIGSFRPMPARALAALKRGPSIFMTIMRRHADTLAEQASSLSPQARRDLKTIQAALHGGFLPRLAALRCARFRRRTLLENMLFGFWFLTNRPTTKSARLLNNPAPAPLPAWTASEKVAAE